MGRAGLRALIALGAIIPACSPRVTGPCPPEMPTNNALARPDGFPMYYSALNESRRGAITSADQWQAFWSDVTANRSPVLAPPAVDFHENMVLIAALGARPSGGYLVFIDEVIRDDVALLEVRVREWSPGKTCVVPAVLTSPVDAVLVTKNGNSLSFIEDQRVHECKCR